MTMRRNLLTDIPGVSVGHAEDAQLASGVTCILFDEPVIAACDVRGGGPGTRETDLLDSGRTVEKVDAIALAGGSAFGLDACAGVQAYLRENDRGFAVRDIRVPIVPGAILFDLLNGGDKGWGRFPPYRELGYAAAAAATPGPHALGSVGAGLGATTVNMKGGIGAASAVTEDGVTVAALAAVNAAGSATVGDGPHFWAGPFEQDREFGGRGSPATVPAAALATVTKGLPRTATTLVVVVTDAALGRTHAKRLATMAQDGLARALYPIHTPLDGDIVFAAATGRRILGDPVIGLTRLGAVAAHVVARAIARGVYEATALPFPGALPAWRDLYPG
ncbi:putative aminopeptidase [Rhodoplanes serenus]|uniref:Aminopeptidase n=1 Tax=Rhodoplanes serenus TaxID=200615 RepID=A0A3S4B456_9BRAD|nr:P1 family peptidase [Rhodoplanes serenus]VCU08693.1 putative aminopeptidase [Rhodoplanes serenus]